MALWSTEYEALIIEEILPLDRLPSWRLWLIACSLSLWLAACGSSSEPATSVVAAAEAPTATASVPTVTPPLPTATPTALLQSPIPNANSALTSTTVTTATVVESATCSQEADIALTNYPERQQLMGCALGPAIFDPVAINEFGPGTDFDRFMLWFSHEQQIYVLRPDKSWQVHPDTWTEDQPTFACNPLGGEATSPPLPRRGFGKLWCEDQALQDVMGTIIKEERLCQHTVLQSFQNGRLLACYEDATIRYLRVMDDGSWDQVLVR